MSAAKVVMNIARISAYPIIAKLGDVSLNSSSSPRQKLMYFQVFGRAEMFIFSIFASALGYVIYAACTDIAQYIVSNSLPAANGMLRYL